MKLHLIKATRTYEGRGYAGPSCAKAGVPEGFAYADLHQALCDAVRLNTVNPVGWQVIEASTGETVRMVPYGLILSLQAARDLLAPVLVINPPTPQPMTDDDGTVFVTWSVDGVMLDVAVDPDGGWTVWRTGDEEFVDMGVSDEGAKFPVEDMRAWLAANAPAATLPIHNRLADLMAAAGE